MNWPEPRNTLELVLWGAFVSVAAGCITGAIVYALGG